MLLCEGQGDEVAIDLFKCISRISVFVESEKIFDSSVDGLIRDVEVLMRIYLRQCLVEIVFDRTVKISASGDG